MKDLTLPEYKEMFRLYTKAMKRQLNARDIDWLVATHVRSDYFEELMRCEALEKSRQGCSSSAT